MIWRNLTRRLRAPVADPRSGIMTQHLAPGYSACGRCRTAWKFVEGHSTRDISGGGAFPLCELCWAEMTPEERLPFYYVLYRQWEWDASRGGYALDRNWADIEQAVLNEESGEQPERTGA